MSHPYKATLLILSFISVFYVCHSQDITWKHRLFIEGIHHYGFVIPHHAFIAYFINEHINGYDFAIGIHTSGSATWQRYFNFPDAGIGFYHSGLGNFKVFGNVNALYHYVDRYYRRQNARFNFGNRFSVGLAYVTKKHDFKTDNFNMAIGSAINVYLHYSIEATYRVTASITAKSGLGLTHISNGNFREPNTGLNLFTGYVSLQYTFHPCLPDYQKAWPQENNYSKSHQFYIIGGFGRKQISLGNSSLYTPLVLSFEYSYRINSCMWIGPAINIYDDKSITKELEYVGDTIENGMTRIRMSLHLSGEINMGKVSYVFQPGIYLKNSFSKDGMINNRLGFRVNINQNIRTSVMIKAHWLAKADFVEWGIGYRWSN